MKKERQDTIRDLLRSFRIETQSELAEALIEKGFQVTQATVSRDIREMKLVKTAVSTGGYRYTLPESENRDVGDRLTRILRDSLISVDYAGHMVVVKTLSGSANIAAEALDTMKWPGILGSIAGDNTVFLVAGREKEAREMTERIRRIMTGIRTGELSEKEVRTEV